MKTHIQKFHPGFSADGIEDGASIPINMAKAMFITDTEEQWMGIARDAILLKHPDLDPDTGSMLSSIQPLSKRPASDLTNAILERLAKRSKA